MAEISKLRDKTFQTNPAAPPTLTTTTTTHTHSRMPIPIITQGITEGLSSIPHAYTILKLAPWVLLLAALKYYFGGARNSSERVMHSKVAMVTVRLSLSLPIMTI